MTIVYDLSRDELVFVTDQHRILYISINTELTHVKSLPCTA